MILRSALWLSFWFAGYAFAGTGAAGAHRTGVSAITIIRRLCVERGSAMPVRQALTRHRDGVPAAVILRWARERTA